MSCFFRGTVTYQKIYLDIKFTLIWNKENESILPPEKLEILTFLFFLSLKNLLKTTSCQFIRENVTSLQIGEVLCTRSEWSSTQCFADVQMGDKSKENITLKEKIVSLGCCSTLSLENSFSAYEKIFPHFSFGIFGRGKKKSCSVGFTSVDVSYTEASTFFMFLHSFIRVLPLVCHPSVYTLEMRSDFYQILSNMKVLLNTLMLDLHSLRQCLHYSTFVRTPGTSFCYDGPRIIESRPIDMEI